MTKKLVSLALVLALTLCLLPAAQAAKLTVQDPGKFCASLSFYENKDSEHALVRQYKAADQKEVPDIVLAYLEMLLRDEHFVYAQHTVNPNGWIYHCFDAAKGYSYDTFNTYISDTDWKTAGECFSICYKPGNNYIYFRASTDFAFGDLGERIQTSTVAKPVSSSSSSSSSKSSSSSSSSSSSFSSSSSSSSSSNRTTRCHSCGGDGDVSCSNCSGRGYKEKRVSVPNYSGKGAKYENVKETCYRCHGSGTVDCSSCGGDGKVEY